MPTFSLNHEFFRIKYLTAVIFLVLFFVGMGSISKASSPDPELWVAAGAGNDFQNYLYIPDLIEARKQFLSGTTKIVSAWQWSIDDDGANTKVLYQYDLRPNAKRWRIVQLVKYDAVGKVISSGRDNYSSWDNIIPGTVGETDYLTVIRWVTY